MSNFNEKARQLLGKLNNEVVPKVKANQQCVESVLAKMKEAIPMTGGYCIDVIHCGSAYEGLSIGVDTDFDVAIILLDPFEACNFKISRDESTFFTLKWKPNVEHKIFSDCDGYIDVGKLRTSIFNSLQIVLNKVRIPNADIEYSHGQAALKVLIRYNTGREISIDMVPQIALRAWGQCPDLKPLHDLPRSLRQYIDTGNRNRSPVMCFNLAVPNAQKYSNPDQLFNVSFSLLEKEFLKSNVDIRDMVRLVNLVAKEKDWKRMYGFKSYYVKTIAIKYSDELKGQSIWDGYKCLLDNLLNEVGRHNIDGFFIINYCIGRFEPSKVSAFQNAIRSASMIDPIELWGV